MDLPADGLLAVRRGVAVEGVEANPESVGVGALNQGAKALVFPWSPLAGVGLTRRLDDVPGVIPPAAVVVGFFRADDLGCGLRILVSGVNGAKEKNTISGFELIVKDGLLRVGLAGEKRATAASRACTLRRARIGLSLWRRRIAAARRS